MAPKSSKASDTAAGGVTVTRRTPREDMPEEGFNVEVPQPPDDADVRPGRFVKHYVVSGAEIDCTNDMIDTALRLGLRPTGDASRDGESDHADAGTRVITWSIPVNAPADKHYLFRARDAQVQMAAEREQLPAEALLETGDFTSDPAKSRTEKEK